MTGGPTKEGERNVKAKCFQEEMALKVALQARWPPKRMIVNDRFYSVSDS